MENNFEINDGTPTLSARGWAVTGLLLATLAFALPGLWKRVEPYSPGADYRFPYELNYDYWLYSRWIGKAMDRYPAFVFGDSVVWGQYAGSAETLSAHLNRALGADTFANAGIDGMHPAALGGLIHTYAGAVRNRKVLVQCNPLWMSSPRHDLQAREDDQRFNHPRLVPQGIPQIPAVRSTVPEAGGILLERQIPLLTWARHLQLAYLENLDLNQWSMMYPHANPLKAFTAELPQHDVRPRSRAVPWTQGGIGVQDFDWVELDTSIQWREFRRALERLQARGNRVFVLVGPFNTHLMTPRSRERYETLRQGIESGLEAMGIPCAADLQLPSDLFADASHPLDAGYRQLAADLLADPEFRAWLEVRDPPG
ncbi:MAG: hypothetical protein U1E27_00770, partial [Kiritimatiellia bacterium]|nr:hypothetical protein [Kiritimatiellia bacterium]